MPTDDYAAVTSSWQLAADMPSSALAAQAQVFEPSVFEAREHSSLMLANPSSLALSLVALATLASARLLSKASRPTIQTAARRAKLQRPRRRAA